MRNALPIALMMLTSGCWTPGPGQLDPTRYPWDQKQRLAHPPIAARGAIEPRTQALGAPPPATGTYCIVALGPATNGIVLSGNAPSTPGCPPLVSPTPAPAQEPPAAALGPAYEWRQVAAGISNRIKLRELTREEKAALEARNAPGGRPLAELTPSEAFAKECADHEDRLRDMSGYHIQAGADGTGRVDRPARWNMMSQDDRLGTIWALAYRTSCAAGQRMVVDVRIVDSTGALLKEQKVSTELTCHGDHATEPRGAIWYRC